MAEIDMQMDADKQNMKEKAKETVANNKRSFGIGAGLGAAAAIFGAGYVAGHKRAENSSLYDKIMRQLR